MWRPCAADPKFGNLKAVVLVNGEMAAEAEFTAMMDLPETAK